MIPTWREIFVRLMLVLRVELRLARKRRQERKFRNRRSDLADVVKLNAIEKRLDAPRITDGWYHANGGWHNDYGYTRRWKSTNRKGYHTTKRNGP
jgi:glycine/D-amino acid oxidase-like deaminating enzyme